MADHNDDAHMPTNDQPLNGPRRSTFGPLVISLLLLAVIAVIFFVYFQL